jgi:hypothetical protein
LFREETMKKLAAIPASTPGQCNTAIDVFDGSGNPIASATVQFKLASAPAAGAYSATPVTATTNGSGRATATLIQATRYLVTCGGSEISVTTPAAGSYLVPTGFVINN